MLSAFMSIQLDAGADTKLSSFPDILAWMDRLQGAAFFVQWDNNAPADITPVSAKWDKTLYEKLFHSNINVKSFAPLDISTLVIKSYPAIHVHDFILNTYQSVGALKTDELPKTSFYTKDFTGLKPLTQVQLKQTQPLTNQRRQATMNDFVVKGNSGRDMARQSVQQNKAIGFNKTANPDLDFGQFHNFHTQVDKTMWKSPPIIPKPEFEYHDILSIITSYPFILRKLGLVIDFELASPPPSANGTVRILPANLSFVNDVTLSSPATAYQYTGAGFYTASKAGSFIEKGMLRVNTDDFSVIQLDTDGAAMKLASHADTVNLNLAKTLIKKSNFITPMVMMNDNAVQQPDTQTDDDDDDDRDEALPSLRSAGIGIVKNGLADHLVKKFVRTADLYKIMINPAFSTNSAALFNKIDASAIQPKANTNAPNVPANTQQPAAGRPIAVQQIRRIPNARMTDLGKAVRQPAIIPVATEILYADDLIFGYRLDIAYEDKPDTWYSLHKRKNSYAFVPVGGSEEQIVPDAGDETDEGCIHLSLAQDDNDPDQDQKISEVIARWEGWSLAVPRIGKGLNNTGTEVSSDEEEKQKYKLDKDMPFRLQVKIGPAPRTLPMLRFGKQYRIKVRTVDIAGNGLPHDVQPENAAAVVRTGIKYLRYEPLPSPVVHQGDEVAGGDRSKMRNRDGESLQHLVIRSNGGVSTADYEKKNITTIVLNGAAAGTLTYIPEAVRYFTAPRTSQQMAEVHGMFDNAFRTPEGAKEAYAFIKSKDKEWKDDGTTKAAEIPVSTGQVDIDYLADPMAAGVIFTLKSASGFETPWLKGESRKFSFYFDEEVNDSNVNKEYSTDQWRSPRSFKIRMVEGFGKPEWKDRVFIIPLPKSATIEVNYACFWRPSDLDKVNAILPAFAKAGGRPLQHARGGVHWMFSPWRTLRLVHAVQQPLEKPAFDKNATLINKNFGDTFATISTKLNVHGSSTDKTDIEAAWQEWVDDLSKPQPVQADARTHVDSLPVAYTDKQLNCSMAAGRLPQGPLRPVIRHAFNDTKHHWVNYTPVATTRYREYFTGVIETARRNGTLDKFSLIQTGETVKLNVLSSAKPVIPVVEYLVPSFNWVREQKGNVMNHLRTANIRVYLKRPWYSSGDEEKIAVILPPKGAEPLRNPVLKKYCTVWGKDPVFVAPDLNNSNYPQVDHFPFAADYDNVKLAEEDVTVAVAAYKVMFDAEKQLHYADIPVNTGFAYFPFIKFSLARYQRHSVRKDGKDCCLSNIVVTDWMQVVAGRVTSLQQESQKNIFSVALKGVAPFSSNPDQFAGAANNARVKITITVENTMFPKSDDAYVSISSRQGSSFIWGKEFDLTFRDVKNGAIDFLQRVELPAAWAGQPYRVVLREYELHEDDPLRVQERAFTNAVTHAYAERLVFMDVFEVNGSV